MGILDILQFYLFMNTQKQITLTDLKGKFTKDFDTFGKMDPFLQFTVGKSFGKTQIASSAGKQPIWKNSVVLTYFDEAQITIKAFDDDVTEKQFIGTGKLEIKSLNFPGGSLQITFLTDNGQNIGTVTGKYNLKNLPPTPLLLLKNIRLELGSEYKPIMKSKPFLQFSTDQNTAATEPKEQVKGLSISWGQNLRLKIKQTSKITISLIDKDKKQDYLFKYECFAKQFRILNGIKKLNVFNKKFQKYGELFFNFEALNIVSKEESDKNIEKEKKAQTQLTAISIQKISHELKFQGKQIYFKLIVGTNIYTSEVFKKNQKGFTTEVKKTLYAQNIQNKLTLVFFSKDMIGESVVGFGHISLDTLLGGAKKINLINEAKEDMGTATLTLTHKTTPCKVMNIQNLVLNIYEGGDMIGQSEPFVVAKIGSCNGSTQIGDSNRLTFKRAIELKYVDEQFLEMQIWDEDLTINELLYTQKLKLKQLKKKNEHQIIYKVEKDGKAQPKAKLTFKYQIKDYIPQTLPQKNTQKVPEIQNPKKKEVVAAAPKPTVVQPQSQKEKPMIVEPKPVKKEQVSPLVQKPIKKEEVPPTVQKPIKKEQVYPIQKPLKTEQAKPQPVFKQSIKTEPNQIPERARNYSEKTEQIKSKREESFKQSGIRQKLSDSRSKGNLILPSIMNNSKIFGDKIFEKQSASTLQTSILAFSIPKASRFSALPKYSGEPSYCMDSSFKPNPNKGAGFGYGRKRPFPEWLERNMRENPSPGDYYDQRNKTSSKGPTFGISHKYYQKVMIPKEMKEQKTSKVQITRKLSPIRQRLK